MLDLHELFKYGDVVLSIGNYPIMAPIAAEMSVF